MNNVLKYSIYWRKNQDIERAYRAFISVYMAGKNHIYFVRNEPLLVHNSHGFSFHIVVVIAVIPRRVHKNNQPWRLGPVDFWQLLFEPLVLRRVFPYKVRKPFGIEDTSKAQKSVGKKKKKNQLKNCKLLVVIQ